MQSSIVRFDRDDQCRTMRLRGMFPAVSGKRHSGRIATWEAKPTTGRDRAASWMMRRPRRTLYHARMILDPDAGTTLEIRFERFVEERREGLTRFLINLGAHGEDARDIVQEGMLRLLRYRNTSPPDEWTPLSYRIVLNLHRDWQRRNAVRGTAALAGRDAEDEAASPFAESPEQRAIHHQQLAMVRVAIESLSPRCREVYLLNRLNGLTYPAIAIHCGISVKAVEKHISNALRELRRLVDRTTSGNQE